MMVSLLPAFTGMIALAVLPNEKSLLWTKWGLYLMSKWHSPPIFEQPLSIGSGDG
jgi:hypothetical protein